MGRTNAIEIGFESHGQESPRRKDRFPSKITHTHTHTERGTFQNDPSVPNYSLPYFAVSFKRQSLPRFADSRWSTQFAYVSRIPHAAKKRLQQHGTSEIVTIF